MTKNSKKTGSGKERSILFIMIVLFSIVGATVLIQKYVNPGVEKVSMAKWYNDYSGAYSIIHDDLCLDDCYGIIKYADTIAFNRNIKVGMGASVGACVEGGDSLWNMLIHLRSHGHELISHGWNHGASVELDWTPEEWSYELDVVESKATLEREVPGSEVSFFIFPYDAYNDERIDELKTAGYLASRGGSKMYADRGINRPHISYNPYRTIFDAYMSKKEQDLVDSSDNPYTTSIYNDDSMCVAQQHLMSAVNTESWSLQELHSVDNQDTISWGEMPVEDYRALLDLAVSMREQGKLWIETPTTVAKYMVTRQALDSIKVEGSKLSFSKRPEDKRYNSPITLVITTRNNPDSLSVWQNGKKIAAEKRGENKFVLTVNSFDNMVVTFL